MYVHPKDAVAQAQTSVTASSAAVAFTAKPGEVVLIQGTAAAYVNIGGSGLSDASATVHTVQVSPTQSIKLRLLTGQTHFKTIRVAADGVVSILRLKEDSDRG